jgi:hypothetical protein
MLYPMKQLKIPEQRRHEKMKKFLSITLAVFLAGGFLLTENKKAEAMNNESAALLTAGLVLIGAPIIHAITHDHHRPAPVYSRPHKYQKVKTTVVYTAPRYEKHYVKKHARYDRRHRHDRFDRDCDDRRSYRRYDHR